MEENKREPVDLLAILVRFKNAFLQLWPLVLVLTILCSGFFGYRAKRAFTPMYESKAIFTVESSYTGEDIFSTGAYYDQYAAGLLASAFPQILSTDMMNDLVIQRMPYGYINGYATAEAVSDSNMMVLKVQSTNPQDAYDYLCAIIECYPQVAVYMVDNPQVKILDAPRVPAGPYNSFSATGSLAKGAFIGALLGLVIVFICGVMTRTIQTADELKTTINLPILVALPRVVKKKRRSGNNTAMISYDGDPNMAESLRGLRTKVRKTLDAKGNKTILVTSTLAGEGKSTVAINLAQSLVRDGHKVLLLDADFRIQSIAKMLEEPVCRDGLMDCLDSSRRSIKDCVSLSERHGLYYVSSQKTDKRHYTIDQRAMRRILKELEQDFDYIVIDTPPCEVVSDTTTLCRCADCVLYIIRQDYAQKAQVLNAVTALHQKDVLIDGCVFNGVPQYHRQYGYGYRSAYGYGYDYGSRKTGYGSRYGVGKYGKYGKQGKYAKQKDES